MIDQGYVQAIPASSSHAYYQPIDYIQLKKRIPVAEHAFSDTFYLTSLDISS